MEEQRETIEQSSPQSVEGTKEEALQGQPLAKLSAEEKIEKLAKSYVESVISVISKKTLTSEQQSELFEVTRRRITIERNQFIQVLAEAEEELKNLQWHNIQPVSLAQSSHGFRGLFIVNFGNFIKAKEEGWIYRPNQDQMIKLVKRWSKKKPCEQFANDLRAKLKSHNPLAPLIETESMKEFKKDILDQILEIKESV
jgi:hypothetical protein